LAEHSTQKFVRKFRSFAEEENAAHEDYRTLSGNEKLQLLLDLSMLENPDEAVSGKWNSVDCILRRERRLVGREQRQRTEWEALQQEYLHVSQNKATAQYLLARRSVLPAALLDLGH
jgi:hypothetical protein